MRILTSGVIMACLVALSARALADSITLKTAARLRPGAMSVVLGDLAVLEGEQAIGLANIAIVPVDSGSAVIEVSVGQVRDALNAAGVNWARINLSGRSVLVRAARDAQAAAPMAMTPAAINPKQIQRADRDADAPSRDAPTQEAIAFDAVIAEASIRGMIASLITTNLRTDARDLRARVDPRDLALLATPLSSGRFEVQPLGALNGDRVEFAVRSWEGATTRTLGQVTLALERRATVTRVRREVPRDHVLVNDDLEALESWVSPGESLSVAPSEGVSGRTTTRALKAGDIVRDRDLQQSMMVQRGDMVTVRCLVGGVAISLQAEARADGAQGDAIEFRKSGERETFVATVTGRNQAVVDLSHR